MKFFYIIVLLWAIVEKIIGAQIPQNSTPDVRRGNKSKYFKIKFVFKSTNIYLLKPTLR
jgi:hypothetical protein